MAKTIDKNLVDKFKSCAEAVAAKVVEVRSMLDAVPYIIDVCEKKLPCELLTDEPDVETGPAGPNGCPTRVKRIIAAPEVNVVISDALAKACEEKGIMFIKNGLRKHLAGIDIGINEAILGVAPSGTCMVCGNSEESRLASMISEISIIILKKSEIYPDLPSVAQNLRDRQKDGKVSYTTFITGPSRTADIERVGAIGVHGPLELHVILLEA